MILRDVKSILLSGSSCADNVVGFELVRRVIAAFVEIRIVDHLRRHTQPGSVRQTAVLYTTHN